MSSMRNAVQRRNHRERAQPHERAKWGILEKHKDYSLRARDYNAKKARLRTLREKASERNPDEFYFGMMRTKVSKTSGAKLGDRGNKALSQDAVRLLKTQDTAYLRTMAMKARRETERLEQNTAVVGQVSKDDDGGKGQHVVFVGDKEEQRGYDRPDSAIRENGSADDGVNGRVARKRRKEQEARQARLEASRARVKEIEAAERELDLQRAKMAKSPSVGGTNKWGVKWKVRQRRK